MKNEYKTVTSRPLPESGVRQFGQWIVNEDWECVAPKDSPSTQALALQRVLELKLNEIFPTKEVRISNKDKQWIDSELKKLDRSKKREYSKRGRSDKYIELSKQFDLKFKKAAHNFLEKNVRSLKEDEPGKAYATLKRMGAQPGDGLDDGSFSLLEHLEANLTNKESVEKIAQHFSRISQEYPALDKEKLSQTVQDKLRDRLKANLPYLSRYKVENMMKKAKKTKSGVPGELPKIFHKEFGPELSIPLSNIYNNMIQTGQWPDSWKIEFGLPLKKIAEPINEDHIRIISLTPFFSKVFEKFVISWLMDYLKEHLDWWQYGGQKGNSVAHYLIDFINFISYNHDLKNIHAVLAVTIDFSKAFNRQNHNILIELLSELGVPGWLLQIVMGFLEHREMEVHFKGETSARKQLPGGGPQGTILGMFLFLILINAAGFRNRIKNTGKLLTGPLNKRKPMEKIHLKFIDDMTAAESINLRDKLIRNPDPDPMRPLNYHDRTLHVLPNESCKLQTLLDDTRNYARDHEMQINQEKTKVILFNTARNFDFMPSLSLDDGLPLDVVEEVRLLGVQVRSDLSWRSNTSTICQKAFARMWMLRRLKPLGATKEELLDVYDKQIRCITEFASAVWTSGLTGDEINQLERIQKCAFAIILAENYSSYNQALKVLNRNTLASRRTKLNLGFAKKCFRSDKYQHWFVENNPNQMKLKTRSEISELLPVQARTKTFLKSPIAYLTNLLNDSKK